MDCERFADFDFDASECLRSPAWKSFETKPIPAPTHQILGAIRRLIVERNLDRPCIERQPLKRSLISQTINRLAVGGAVKAIGPLAHRGGLVDAVSDVIGEIIRAGRTPAEFEAIVESRSRDIHSDQPALTPRQIDFDREISLIYSAYVSALDRNNLTDADFDQLRALEILRGDINGKQITVPWLAKIRLLIIDGFFDFTPIQGEILRLLVPAIPGVIVTLNRDDHNPEIFRPFCQTIDL